MVLITNDPLRPEPLFADGRWDDSKRWDDSAIWRDTPLAYQYDRIEYPVQDKAKMDRDIDARAAAGWEIISFKTSEEWRQPYEILWRKAVE